jgi:hypothetical protein
VEGAALRPFFISRRTTLQTWLHFGLKGLPVPTLTLLWLATTATVQQGRMIKHYLHAVQHVSDIDTRSEDLGKEAISSREYWSVQQYLILAEFIWTHHLSYKVEICGIDLFDLVPTLLRDLRTALEDSAGSSKYQNARLWALFIGSHAERLASKSRRPQRPVTSSKQDRDNDGSQQSSEDLEYDGCWFSTSLALHLRCMSLATWKEVSKVLQAFNYADVIRPLGEDLLAEVLNRQ